MKTKEILQGLAVLAIAVTATLLIAYFGGNMR